MNGKEEAVDDNETKNNKYSKLPNILERGFVAPDGGWGWMVVVAAGFSNFCTLSMMLSYGLIFRDHFNKLGINASENTTILNINYAVMACVGLANGPLFRKYSYRQVSCVGAFVCAVSICALSFMKTFYGVLIFFSILYATGNSLAMSSCSLALNTYFKKKRRMAVGLAWTCTGLGPIIIPQENEEKMNGALTNEINKALLMDDTRYRTQLINVVENQSNQRFGSLGYCDDKEGNMELDMIASEIPMMSRSNDGWFSKLNSSNASFVSKKTFNNECTLEYDSQTKSRPTSVASNIQSSLMASSTGISVGNLNKQSNEMDKLRRRNSYEMNYVPQVVAVHESTENATNGHNQNIGGYGMLSDDDKMTKSFMEESTSMYLKKNHKQQEDRIQPWYMQAMYTVVGFFDLNLLRDPVYVNLMIGTSLVNFADLNFFTLTPFILSDNDLKKNEVANVMSVLAIFDVITRLMIPVIAARIRWENRIFYITAMVLLAAGRILLAHVRNYNFLIAAATFIGVGKAFRTVFSALVLPTHVPLERLPAATGLQLATGGIIYLTFGPIVGWIRDTSGNYTITLHCLNVFTYLVIISWTLELWYCSMKRKRLNRNQENSALTDSNIYQMECLKQ